MTKKMAIREIITFATILLSGGALFLAAIVEAPTTGKFGLIVASLGMVVCSWFAYYTLLEIHHIEGELTILRQLKEIDEKANKND